MEHEMKLAPAAVRQSRLERGWSQEQVAVASGLSLRTIQRVESEGIASLSTAASLAATYGVPLIQLQESPAQPQLQNCVQLGPAVYGTFFLSFVIIMLAAIGESARLPGDPRSAAHAAVNILAAVAGCALLIPSATRILRARQYAGAALAAVGTPLVTLFTGGLVVSSLTGHPPLWPLVGLGAGGLALVVMAAREFKRRYTAIA